MQGLRFVFVQVFLQGKIFGIEQFTQDASGGLADLGGRCLYVSLLSEVVPRALLKHLGLSPELLGTCGGGQFMAVLTSESLPAANAFLVDVTRRLGEFSERRLRLIWSSTENLGAWEDVRKRLDEGMAQWRGTAALEPEGVFEPFAPGGAASEVCAALYNGLPGTLAAEWAPEQPGMIAAAGEPLWLASHSASASNGVGPASVEELASRAKGLKAWGILRGDVDQFAARLRKAQTIEEHIQLSVFFRQFFAGEVQLLCTQNEFRNRVSVLYTGGDEFAIAGAWDALIDFARELERLFRRSADELLKEYPGAEGKTLSMAIALADSESTTPASLFAEAARQLEIAKSAGRDCISLLGRVLDWKQLSEAAELRQGMLRLITEFGCPPQFLGELGSFYRETDRVLPAKAGRRAFETQDRPWRLHRRLNRVLDGPERNKEFQKARNTVLAAFLTRGQATLKLRPSGRVALEWARWTEEVE
jgi:CRISPR-associated protein Csm1